MLLPRHLRLWTGVALGLVALLAACGPAAPATESLQNTPSPQPADTGPAPTIPGDESPPVPATATPKAIPSLAPIGPTPLTTPAQGPVTGEVPADLLEGIFQDAEQRTGVDREQFTLLRAQAVTWRDGAMGCPQPGMEYTQALVPGYWVVLQVEGREMNYHASDRGSFFLCESPLPHQEPLPGDGSN